MPQTEEEHGWQSDDNDDDWDEEDEDATQPCPYCRRDIHEDAVRCPYCENYLSKEDAQAGNRSKWFYILAVVCLAIAIGWALMWW
jgi:ferredoxin-thioredoxin reductase catalytic subunit